MSTTRDKKGRWTVRIHFRQPDGRMRRVERTSSKWTKRQAEIWERQTRQQLADGTYDQTKKEVVTIKRFAEEFISTFAKANNRESEIQAKRYIFDAHINPAFGDLPLHEVSARRVEAFKAKLLAKRSPKTVNNVLTVLRKTLSWAVDVGELEALPRFKLCKVPPQPFDWLDFEPFEKLVAAAGNRDPQLMVAVLLAGEAGLRRGELAGLKWEDINFRLGQLEVVRALWAGKEQAPKGGRSRVVPLTSRLASALKAHRHLCGAYVLARPDGAPWSIETFRWWGDQVYQAAKLTRPRKPWHALRHTFCSHLAMQGASPKAIQELAGHADLTTTQRYLHLAPRALDNAIRLLERPHGHSTDPDLQEAQ